MVKKRIKAELDNAGILGILDTEENFKNRRDWGTILTNLPNKRGLSWAKLSKIGTDHDANFNFVSRVVL